jgi:penicillin amidase
MGCAAKTCFAYAIDHTAKTSAHLRQAADILRNWNGEMTTDSPAPAIVAAARTALWPLVLKPRLGDDWQAYLWSEKSYVQEEMVVHQPARWLPSQYATWNALLTAAVQAGLSDSHAPSNLNNWHWGSVHRVQIQHPLYSLVPLMHAMTGIKSQPISGDVLTVKSIGVTFGPSERFTADMSDLDGSTLNLVVGESGNPYSPFYRDQWDFWYNGTTFALPFTNAAVAAATTHTLTLTPTGAAH